MKRFLFFTIILIIYSLSLYSQGVVVSEYYNENLGNPIKPDGEWAELLVTKNGISLAGCKIRDYSSSSGVWMPAFEFNDIPLWKNLHEGTIIMVYFKTAPITDDNKSDGYIQVGAEDTKYFTFLGTDIAKSLNLNQTLDMVQILDQSDNNIHTLGHAKSGSEGAFTAISGINKICYNGEIATNVSVAVLPGAKLADYDVGYDVSQAWTTKLAASDSPPNVPSPGLPNQNNIHTRSNINFWRVLREPEWNNPTFSTSTPDYYNKIILTWKPIPSTIEDIAEGYILLRAEGKTWPNNSLPVDSKIYKKGDVIGNAVVVDHIQKFSSDSYTDQSTLECGKDYIYAIFAYRYDADDLAEDQNKKELSARGRAYNETNYDTSTPITIEEPEIPIIYTKGNVTEICRGDELIVYLNETNLINCTYQWLIDGTNAPGETANKITVKQSGNYSIRIINSVGCESVSKIIKITVNDPPTIIMQEDKGGGKLKSFLNDTTIYLCNGSTLKLVAKIVGKFDKIQWLKDGTSVLEGPAKFSLDITTGGKYQVFAYNGICAGKTAIITVKIIDVDLIIKPSSLSLDYDKKPTGTIRLTNKTAYELILQAVDIQLPVGFTIINPPTAPYVILAADFLDLTIKFDTPDYKTVSGKMEINPPCGNQYTVDLTGVRKKPNATFPVAELTSIDFGIIPNCLSKDTSFIIRMEGTDEIVIKSDKNLDKYIAYTVVYDTGEQNPNLPWKLNDGEIKVYIAFSRFIPGIYNEDIKLDYTVDGVDSPEPLVISLYGETQKPKLVILDDYKKFAFQLFGCNNTIDTIIRVSNQSPFDITINNNFVDNHIQFKSLPQLIHSMDTVDLDVTLSAGIYSPTTFIYEPCSVSSDSITVEISALAPDMVFSLPNNEIDFGTIDNCQFSGDSIIKVAFSGNGVPCTIGSINVPLGLKVIGLNVGDNVSTTAGQFDVVIKSDFIGTMDDNLEITLSPCNIKKVISVKGTRLTPLEPLISDAILDFGDYILGDPYPEKILSITNNDTQDIMINNIQGITAPYVLVNNDLPYLLIAGEKKDYTFRYERMDESDLDILDIKIIYDSYCDFDKTIQLKGKAKSGVLPANIKLSIQSGIAVGLGKIVKIPITIQVNDTTTLSKCGIKTVNFGIQYDPRVLDITNAVVGNAIKSQISGFSLVRKSLGNEQITFNVNLNYDIVPGNLAELEVLGLLGDTTESALSIISPELTSESRTINIEIQNGSAGVTGQCPLNNRWVELNGQQGGIIAIVPNPVSDIVTITLEVISDDKTNCAIYDNLGKNVRNIISESLKPEIYKYQINVSDLQSGVYYIVFKNGIIINTTKLIINK